MELAKQSVKSVHSLQWKHHSDTTEVVLVSLLLILIYSTHFSESLDN